MSATATQTKAIPQWLLTRLLEHPELSAHPIERIDEVVACKSAVSEIYRYRIWYEDDQPAATIFVKLPRPEALPCPRREIDLYRTLPELMPDAPLVPCYDAAYFDESGSCCLVLEDVTATHYVTPLGLPPTQPDAERIVDLLARLHAFFWNHDCLVRKFGGAASDYQIHRTVGHAECYYPLFTELMDDRLDETGRRIFAEAFEHHATWLVHRFGRGQLTLLHGDAHAGNFLLARSEGSGFLVDWQTPSWVWTVGMGVSDLAYLMVRYWPHQRTTELAMPLLKRYAEKLRAGGVRDYAWNELLADFQSSCLLNLYIVVEEALRTDPRKWYGQWTNLLAVIEHFSCGQVLHSA